MLKRRGAGETVRREKRGRQGIYRLRWDAGLRYRRGLYRHSEFHSLRIYDRRSEKRQACSLRKADIDRSRGIHKDEEMRRGERQNTA